MVGRLLPLDGKGERLVPQRGYALLTDPAGHAVTSTRQAHPGDALKATLADGVVDLTVAQQPRLL